MIPASVWNWGALQYEYYVIPNEPDFGGYGASRGLKASATKGETQKSVSFDDILPVLSADAIEVGSGFVCVGELFVRDGDCIYERLDFSRVKDFSESLVRLLDVFEVANQSRQNPSSLGDTTSDLSRPAVVPPTATQPITPVNEPIQVPEESAYLVWETLLPILTGVGLGIAVYQYVSEDVRLRDVLLIWGAGAGFGLAIGSEIRRARFLREG